MQLSVDRLNSGEHIEICWIAVKNNIFTELTVLQEYILPRPPFQARDICL